MNRQFTNLADALRCSCHAPTSRIIVARSGPLRSKHCRDGSLILLLTIPCRPPWFGL